MMEIIFREIREFGESLILLDQHPSKISLYALGNSYCTICMNLKHKTDINAIGQCMLLDKDRDILGTLPVGQAVAKLQGRIPMSFQIEIPKFFIKKGSITDTYLKEHMKHIAPAAPEEDFRIPEQKVNSEVTNKPKSVDSSVMVLLQDIQNFPESGIALRYKRLGVSVRQGQKLKAKMLQEGLIEERLETTKSGRLKFIQATEEGKKLLFQAK
ncbi:hypothetical protein ACFL02_10165 [Planctomycetota bacterium]